MDLEERFGSKKYLVLVILVGIICIIIFIYSLVYIWTRPVLKGDNKLTSELDLGNYAESSFSIDDQVKIYSNYIASLLSNEDIAKLYSMLDSQYKEFTSYSEEDFGKYLMSKQLKGKKLKLKEYKNASFNGKSIIKLTYTDNENSVSQDITVVEKSPNDYTINFDNIMAFIKKEKNFEINGLKITLSNQTYYSNEFKVRLSITNVGNSNVIFNQSKSAETIYLSQGANVNTLVSSSIFMGQPFILVPNQTINYELRFLISDFTFINIQKMVLKDVINTEIGNTQDIEININD